MIEYVPRKPDGVLCPRFICDRCRKPIELFPDTKDDVNGNLMWLEADDGKMVGHPLSIHKTCTHAFDQEHGSEIWYAECLDVALAQLAHNTGIDMAKARKEMLRIHQWGI